MPVYQELMILFSWTRWMEAVLYSQMFYAIFQFCALVKLASLDGNITNVRLYDVRDAENTDGIQS